MLLEKCSNYGVIIYKSIRPYTGVKLFTDVDDDYERVTQKYRHAQTREVSMNHSSEIRKKKK